MVRTPSSHSSTSTSTSTSTSRNSSFYPPSALSLGWEADDEATMSADDKAPTRPLSVAIPKGNAVHGPFCPRRPNLREILANTSDAPWTLAAFMAYLSNNHCLETLEFTMDAGRYKKHYAKMLSRAVDGGSPPSKDREYVQALWQRLVDAYIRPNGSREVNLPSNVRDPLLTLSPAELPPAPETLDPAVTKIYELMEESVLVPFLNSAYPQTAGPTISSFPANRSDESLPTKARTYEDRSPYSRRSRQGTPKTAVEPHAHSYSPPSAMNRRSAAMTTSSFHHRSKSSAKLPQTTSSPATTKSTPAGLDAIASGSEANVSGSGSGPGMTDDSGSTESPTNDSPTTPPLTPLSSDNSPKRDSGMWKKLSRMSGIKVGKRKSQGGLREE